MSDFRAKSGGSIAKDGVISSLALAQHGVVSVDQLRAAGFDKHHVLHRVRTGRLHRIHHGVYAVGHRAISQEGRWMAAVLACGRRAVTDPETDGNPGPARWNTILDRWGAAISHRSAAALWELLPAADGPVDISVPSDAGRKTRRGIRLHRRLSLLPAAVTLRSAIPVTTPARTISDLRRIVPPDDRHGSISAKELRQGIRQANVLGLPIGDETGRDRSRSDLEQCFLRLCRCSCLPAPEVNVRVGPHLVDFLWRDRSLVVETDGYRYHRGRVAFEDDRERDLRLRALGFDVVRVSEKQVDEEPERVAEVLAAALRVGADGREREDRGESRERRR